MLPSDRVEIRGLVVTTIVGVLPHERTFAQPLRIDLDLFVSLREAGRTDELAATANYGDVAERVARVIREAHDLLLERLADRVARLVLAIDHVEAVEVTITKLRPPIPEQLDSTAVRILRHRGDYRSDDELSLAHVAVVALGSNLGDRAQYLRTAVASLGVVERMSQLFESPAVGGPAGQGPHLNMVLAVRTGLDPYAFLRRCQLLEAAALRQREIHCGPRTLDVDLLFYDDVRIDDPQLTLPHPRYTERPFVLAPLAEVAPERCPTNWAEHLPPLSVVPRGPLALGPNA